MVTVNIPTESSAGEALLYISQKLSHGSCKDIASMLYCSSLLESVFIEISLPNSPNIIAESVRKHPLLTLYEFNNYLEPL